MIRGALQLRCMNAEKKCASTPLEQRQRDADGRSAIPPFKRRR
jgi:hypothetical protein